MNFFLRLLSFSISFLILYCTTKKDSFYDISQTNIKLSYILIFKNLECNANKQSNFIFFPADKNQVDLCISEIYFLNCEKWNVNILPDSCNFIGIQIK